MSHVGLQPKNIIYITKCDEGEKYERNLTITFLPRTNSYEDCLAMGCLERSKHDPAREYYNPVKFYDPEKMAEALIHILAAFSAFRALKHGWTPHQAFHRMFMKLTAERQKIAALTEEYYHTLKELSQKSE
jgi:hypothetical protein